jgi:hypothetical protein
MLARQRGRPVKVVSKEADMPVDNALIHADSAPLPCAESEPSIMLSRHPEPPRVLRRLLFPREWSHDEPS